MSTSEQINIVGLSSFACFLLPFFVMDWCMLQHIVYLVWCNVCTFCCSLVWLWINLNFKKKRVKVCNKCMLKMIQHGHIILKMKLKTTTHKESHRKHPTVLGSRISDPPLVLPSFKIFNNIYSYIEMFSKLAFSSWWFKLC